jgi:hypothetical protein
VTIDAIIAATIAQLRLYCPPLEGRVAGAAETK